jgi:hypothetical protein
MNYKETMLENFGATFQITYTKKDGTERSIKCKTEKNYTEHVSGKQEYVVVFDIEEQDYRVVNTNTIKSFSTI